MNFLKFHSWTHTTSSWNMEHSCKATSFLNKWFNRRKHSRTTDLRVKNVHTISESFVLCSFSLSLPLGRRSVPISHILIPLPGFSVSAGVGLTQLLTSLPGFCQEQDAQSLSPVKRPSLYPQISSAWQSWSRPLYSNYSGEILQSCSKTQLADALFTRALMQHILWPAIYPQFRLTWPQMWKADWHEVNPLVDRCLWMLSGNML